MKTCPECQNNPNYLSHDDEWNTCLCRTCDGNFKKEESEFDLLLDSLDAAIFTGDKLISSDERAELQRFILRWTKAIFHSEPTKEK